MIKAQATPNVPWKLILCMICNIRTVEV